MINNARDYRTVTEPMIAEVTLIIEVNRLFRTDFWIHPRFFWFFLSQTIFLPARATKRGVRGRVTRRRAPQPQRPRILSCNQRETCASAQPPDTTLTRGDEQTHREIDPSQVLTLQPLSIHPLSNGTSADNACFINGPVMSYRKRNEKDPLSNRSGARGGAGEN